MRKLIISVAASAIMAAGVAAGLPGIAQAGTAPSGSAAHAAARVVAAHHHGGKVRFPGGGCGSCHLL